MRRSSRLYFLSLNFIAKPTVPVTILLLGRALLGAGESFIITGAQSWGLAILGAQNTSRVLAWIGGAMFGAFAAGAPIGAALYAHYGFVGIALATILIPLARGWPTWPAFSIFALTFILTRVFLGHLPDRLSSAKVALICVLVEAAGLGLIELAPLLTLALTGAALTGFGYSLVYPGLGVEAVRRVAAQDRGLAMGAYTAFLDVTLGFGTPCEQ